MLKDGLVGTFVRPSDTLAQWVMALFTIAFVVLVWRTLIATQDMARDTRQIGEAQARAYIHAEILGIEIAKVENKDGSNIRFAARMRLFNSGSTPAHDVEMFYDIQEARRGIVSYNLLNEGKRSDKKLHFIPSGRDSPMRLSRVWQTENMADRKHGRADARKRPVYSDDMGHKIQ